jgi:hypothetical protein
VCHATASKEGTRTPNSHRSRMRAALALALAGCRADDGSFSPERFTAMASKPQVCNFNFNMGSVLLVGTRNDDLCARDSTPCRRPMRRVCS